MWYAIDVIECGLDTLISNTIVSKVLKMFEFQTSEVDAK
jgi:hypothetical protein